MKNLNYNITLSNGNKKLKNTENVRFIIFNLPAVITCPCATDLCKLSCYAKKAERLYPDVLPCRERNFAESQKDSFVCDMIDRIESKINSKAYQNKKVIVRIHESGDFYNKEYVKKWLSISLYFFMIYGDRVVFMAYTKSLDFFQGETLPENFCLRASVWKDTCERARNMIYENDYPIYTALSAADIQKLKDMNISFYECKCSDCGECGKCWNKEEKNIIVKIH